MLIATLPPLHRDELLEAIISNPYIGAVRYNTGMVLSQPIRDTLNYLKDLCAQHSKQLWIDLKGRQLRIVQWAAPDYGRIILNHEVEVEGPAVVQFRGDEYADLKFAHGNEIFVDPPPRQPVGQGQAINIIGDNVRIHGYLTLEDRQWLRASVDLGILRFCLSFVEKFEDIREAEDELRASSKVAGMAKYYLKIESPKGFEFVCTLDPENFSDLFLIAARDDWFVTSGPDKFKLLDALEHLVQLDPSAVLASRLFVGLENCGKVTLADYSDLELMWRFGYRNFMLSDGICSRHFAKAIEAWQMFEEFQERRKA